MFTTTQEQVLFDTTDYNNYYETEKDEYEIEDEVFDAVQDDLTYEQAYAVDFLNDFIKHYEKRYRTHVCGILLIAERSQSRYGNWNSLNGRTGYRLINNLDELFESSADSVRIYVDEDGYINADYFGRDGTDYSKMKLIPQSAEDNIYKSLAKEYGSEYLVGDLYEEDYVDYFEKKNELKPTKFFN